MTVFGVVVVCWSGDTAAVQSRIMFDDYFDAADGSIMGDGYYGASDAMMIDVGNARIVDGEDMFSTTTQPLSSSSSSLFEESSSSRITNMRRSLRPHWIDDRLVGCKVRTKDWYKKYFTYANHPHNVIAYYVPFIVGPISLLSSLYVCYLIVVSNQKERSRRRRQRQRRQAQQQQYQCCSSNISFISNLVATYVPTKPRDQLLLGLSFLDIMASFAYSFSTTPGYGSRYPGYGNITTCNIQGFFVQLGFGVPLYNAALCVYFVLSVRYKVSEDTLSKYFVPISHVSILSYIFTTAIFLLRRNMFNPAGVMGCWISGRKVSSCEECPAMCDRGNYDVGTYEIYFLVIHLSISFIIVVISMIVLYCTVRQVETKGRRWNFSNRLNTRWKEFSSRIMEQSREFRLKPQQHQQQHLQHRSSELQLRTATKVHHHHQQQAGDDRLTTPQEVKGSSDDEEKQEEKEEEPSITRDSREKASSAATPEIPTHSSGVDEQSHHQLSMKASSSSSKATEEEYFESDKDDSFNRNNTIHDDHDNSGERNVRRSVINGNVPPSGQDIDDIEAPAGSSTSDVDTKGGDLKSMARSIQDTTSEFGVETATNAGGFINDVFTELDVDDGDDQSDHDSFDDNNHEVVPLDCDDDDETSTTAPPAISMPRSTTTSSDDVTGGGSGSVRMFIATPDAYAPMSQGTTVAPTKTNQKEKSTAKPTVRKKRKSRQSNNQQPKLPLSRRTMETGMLYSAAFILVYVPLALVGMMKSGPIYDVALIASATLTPLQGFFNLLIFTSPKWLKSNAWLRFRAYILCCGCCCDDSIGAQINNNNNSGSCSNSDASSTRRGRQQRRQSFLFGSREGSSDSNDSLGGKRQSHFFNFKP